MGRRLGRRIGSRIGAGSSSTSIISGLLPNLELEFMGMRLNLRLIEEDTSFIKVGTPVITGRLINSYSVEDGAILSSAPYVFEVESRRNMIRNAEESIMNALIDRAINELESQVPLNNIKVPIGTVMIKVG